MKDIIRKDCCYEKEKEFIKNPYISTLVCKCGNVLKGKWKNETKT